MTELGFSPLREVEGVGYIVVFEKRRIELSGKKWAWVWLDLEPIALLLIEPERVVARGIDGTTLDPSKLCERVPGLAPVVAARITRPRS
ncbi:MAG: hypothetical protein HY791_02785 [Deltaproteobacteria bacterium]|nr:hypothetical protein [Deltaproteobacteria bacterium]